MSQMRAKHRPRSAAPTPNCNADSLDSPGVQESLDCLLHYHTKHTADKITRFRCDLDGDDDGPGREVVVYVVSDADCIATVREAVKAEFPDDDDEDDEEEPFLLVVPS
jgi:hypothetical protein